ncbi:undecaprenyl-diphosphatase [Geomicrobium halophilum]|uniref:Undecaprenyl-diphosphatase n=1 Tax=Geomicrobium halophilum TaxID=549000 RepID=A0A841PWV9_9BACL|nr:phosphatase PAP2 family protein [Geomicrobium halophilum]MBB6448385.1 undecaprenyl-diphosphatase [Geomicrobium halophilum]
MKHKIIKVILILTAVIAMTWFLKPVGLWLDQQVMEWLTNIHELQEQSLLYQSAEGITVLGSSTVFFLFAAGILAFLLWKRRYTMLAEMMIFLFGGIVINTLVKFLIARPRPHGILSEMEIMGEGIGLISYSFPSGHAFRATLIMFCLLYVIACFSSLSANAKRMLYIMVGILALAVIASRTVIGVHYPTDVITAFLYAGTWFGIVLMVSPEKKTSFFHSANS